MGFYINPQDMTKEQFLAANGKEVTEGFIRNHLYDDAKEMPVCLVDNYGQFTAAGIAYDRRETEAFLYPDPREKQWFIVSRDILMPILEKQGYKP